MRISAIDIGTNTILMLTADVGPEGSVSVVRDEHAIARLGQGVDKSHRLSSEGIERTLAVLRSYRSIANDVRSEHIVACGTSAIRDAIDRQEFLDTVKNQIDVDVEVLDGDTEALLTYRGAVSELAALDSAQSFGVIDIGGGSTELISGVGTTARVHVSLDIGSVRLTERYFRSDPPTSGEIESAASEIERQLQEFHQEIPQMLIGVAGTATTLAALDLQLNSYDGKKVGGYFLSQRRVHALFEELSRKSIVQLRHISQIHPQRADIIVAGTLILQTVLDRFQVGGMTVSDRGLRYGLLLRAAERFRAG
ncbi:MAG: Ppx/GppA family phosphatase [Ignavibacteriales bacterium]|nr:Ppx/GppA family phosphatase [Ignavibacteriales bacterium]